MKIRANIAGYGFLMPAILIISIFTIIPIFFAFFMAFNKVDLVAGTYTFNGLQNFTNLFSDPKFYASLKNTLKYVIIVVPIQTILAMIIASILNSKIKFKRGFVTLFFLPTLTSSAAMTLIFMWLFNKNGIVNEFLYSNFSISINFITDAKWALGIIMIMNIFSTIPHFMVVFLAGLQNIPNNLYEAASVDGANAVKKFMNITIPQLAPITLYVVTMGVIGCFQIFDQAYIMSGGTGGPSNSTLTFSLYIYQLAFQNYGTMGVAAALSIILSSIIFITSFMINKLSKTDEVNG